MANRYFVQERVANEWREIDTRPLRSKAEAQGFIAILRNAPIGNWAERDLAVFLDGRKVAE